MFRKGYIIFLIAFFISIFVTVPICFAIDRITHFQEKVWPNLTRIAEQENIYKKLLTGEKIEDVMAFSYELAVMRLQAKGNPKISLGGWIKELEYEVKFVLAWISFMPWWPKTPASHEEALRYIRLVLAKGAYERLIFILALGDRFYKISTNEVINRLERKSPLPLQEMISLDVFMQKIKR